jgi:hypothetical protein
MPKKSSLYQVEIIGGDKSDPIAQAKALQSVSIDIAQSMRRLLAEGWLINDNGRIIPNPERIQMTNEGWRVIRDPERTIANDV